MYYFVRSFTHTFPFTFSHLMIVLINEATESVFSVVTGLIAEVLLLLFFVWSSVYRLNIVEREVKWPLHFQVSNLLLLLLLALYSDQHIDSWGTHLDENINSGAILSFDAVCIGSPVIIMLQKCKLDS